MAASNSMEDTTMSWRVLEACKTDDLQYFQQVLEFERERTGPTKYQEEEPWGIKAAQTFALETAIWEQAPNIMNYLLANGADVGDVHLHGGPKGINLELVEVLQNYGYDINKPAPGLLLDLVDNETKLRWALEHGAVVTPESNDLLTYAALQGSLETFKLLRSLGAPMDRNLLHTAVGRVGKPWGDMSEEDISTRHVEGLKIVRYLVDELHYDVNEWDHPKEVPQPLDNLAAKYSRNSKYCGPPLHYCVNALHEKSLEVVGFLLSRGADPTSALQVAEARERNRGRKLPFIAYVKAYQDGKKSSGLGI